MRVFERFHVAAFWENVSTVNHCTSTSKRFLTSKRFFAKRFHVEGAHKRFDGERFGSTAKRLRFLQGNRKKRPRRGNVRTDVETFGWILSTFRRVARVFLAKTFPRRVVYPKTFRRAQNVSTGSDRAKRFAVARTPPRRNVRASRDGETFFGFGDTWKRPSTFRRRATEKNVSTYWVTPPF